MQELLIYSKYPQAKVSKTRLGRDVGYDESALLARFLLEDLVEEASQVCDVSILCPYEDLVQFEEFYPHWSIEAYEYLPYDKLVGRMTRAYRKREGNVEKIINIPGDLVVSQEMLYRWFNDLYVHDLSVVPSTDLRFAMLGSNTKGIQLISQNLINRPGRLSLAGSLLKSWYKGCSTKVYAPLRDIDTQSDLKTYLQSHTFLSQSTQEFAEYLAYGITNQVRETL